MNVLLTGATGFVGNKIALSLVAQGIRPICVIRRGSHAPCGLDSIETNDVFSEGKDFWREAFGETDTVIHAAWYTEPGKYLQSPLNLTCLSGTLCMAESAMSAGVRRFVGIGTCFEYDLSYGYLTPETPLSPETPYAKAKAACWDILNSTLPSAGISFAWCRLFYLFGDGEHPARLVPYIRGRLSAGLPVDLTAGTQIRDFLDVEQAGKLISEVALSEVSGAVNICSGTGTTVASLARQIASEYDRQDLLRFGVRSENLTDPPCVIGKPSRI